MAVTPANKIVRGGDLQTVGTEIKSAIADKQDTISDLSSIRSGAALGSTSVQPVDIEDMVEAEPIGSIVPPVNPSEFATKEELSQLGQKVGALSAAQCSEDGILFVDDFLNIGAKVDNTGFFAINGVNY